MVTRTSRGPIVWRALVAMKRESMEKTPLIRITREDAQRIQDLIHSPIIRFQRGISMSDPTRQHYQMATGKGLEAPPSKSPSPGMKKGGKASTKPMKKPSGRSR